MKKQKKKLLSLFMTFVCICTLFTGVLGSSKTAEAANPNDFVRACWVSYIDIQALLQNTSEDDFRRIYTSMCQTALDNNCNTMLVQVRPFGDALYPSSYFPWSSTINSNCSNPGYNPLAAMVQISHSMGLKIEAWLNPYRVSSSTSKTNQLNAGTYSESNQNFYNKYKSSMIEYTYSNNNCIALNPADATARDLIVKGVQEIVKFYDVDGIVFDDYFYIGTMGNGLSAATKKSNVNSLVRSVYQTIKAQKPNVVFGISPAGNLDNARSDGADIDTWLSSSGYIDYLAPQIYWSNSYVSTYTGATLSMYSDRVNAWNDINNNNTPIYPALALYKAGTSQSTDVGWSNSSTNLRDQWVIARDSGMDGYSLFRFSNFYSANARTELDNLSVEVRKGYLDTTNKYLAYQGQVQGIGWQTSTGDNDVIGTIGQSKRLEAFRAKLGDLVTSGGIQYRSFVQGIGWQGWAYDGAVSGTVGAGKRIEAVQMSLTGAAAQQYDIYYRSYVQGIGWMGWTCNGRTSGTMDKSLRIEAMQFQLVKKGAVTPTPTTNASIVPLIRYNTHVQTYGWLPTVCDGAESGTNGQSKRMEAVNISLENQEYAGNIEYRTHVQTYGWLGWSANGASSGVTGQSKRMEAIEIRLTGDIANYYDVYYQVHAQNFGWLGWAKNGETAGTTGMSKRLEALKVVLVPKGGAAPGSAENSCQQADIKYRTHVQGIGWQGYSYNGLLAGTEGQSKRLEGIDIELVNPKYSGSIEYTTHVQSYGWSQGWIGAGSVAGTMGQSKRLEAIRIQLTGDMANHYNVVYRVHIQGIGWQDWKANGDLAGTEGQARRLEAIQIKLVEK